jgi:hypothetical protein
MVLGLAHAVVVGLRYHVGSFDDDANYVLVARAIAMGAGLTTKVNGAVPIVGVYPPGYPTLLAPLALIWPHGLLPYRALSLACYLALFPLTWVYLRQRDVARTVGLFVLLLLALGPVPATYATMVMAEMPFLVALLVLLLVLPHWEAQAPAITGWGIATALLAASLIWLKEAGVGVAIGVVAWLVIRRLWRKAALVAAGTSLLMVPVLVARISAGVSLIGSRYSTEIGGPYPGGMLARIVNLPTGALSDYFHPALGNTIIPTATGADFAHGPVKTMFAAFAWTAAPLILIGFVVWARHHRDVTCVAVPIYLVETFFFPYTNERRVILVLPVVLACYALGVWSVLSAVLGAARNASRRSNARVLRAVPAAYGVLALAILLPQFSRDYLFTVYQHSSEPAGSPYMSFLQAVGRPDDIVETSYLWTTALFSGHVTAASAFETASCDRAEVVEAVHRDNAGFLLSAALNKPDIADGSCVVPLVANEPGVVRLYRSPDDLASVFELIGAGSPHPGLRDLTAASLVSSNGSPILERLEPEQMEGDPAGTYPSIDADGGTAVLTWTWNDAQPVSQISLGGAGGEATATSSVVVQIEGPDAQWHRVLAASGPVGAADATRYLLASFPTPLIATAVRVTVTAQGSVAVHDLHVLGGTT